MFTEIRFTHRALISAAVAITMHSALAQGVTTSYTLVGAEPTVNEPIIVEFSLHNGLSENLVVDLEVNSHGYGAFAATLTRPNGTSEDAPKPWPAGSVSVRRVSVPFSGSHSKLLLLNEWFDFDVPGRYILDVVTTKPLRNESGMIRVPYPAPGHLVIDVGPRDPLRLQRICEDLEREIESPQAAPSPVAKLGLRALSHVKDPVAVPFLARLLKVMDKQAQDLVRGLEAIGDGPAVDALMSHVNDQSEDTRNLARSALTSIEARVSDPAIRQKIRVALQ